MSATADKIVTIGGQTAIRGIEDNSSASSSVALTTKKYVDAAISTAQTYANKRANGIITLNGSSSASSLALSISAATVTVMLSSSQAANQAFTVTSATSHSSVSASDTVLWLFPAGTTGVKTFHLSGSVAATVQIASSGTTGSIAKSGNMFTALLTGSGVFV